MTKATWKDTLNEVVNWPITHVSLYRLTIHEATKLYFEYTRGLISSLISIPDDDYVADLYAWSVKWLEEHGFNRHEVSNFARPGYESKHNIVYWERNPYKEFGLGVYSFDGIVRLQNQKI